MGTKFLLFISLVCLLFGSSCTSTNKIAYFQNNHDTAYRKTLGVVEAPYQTNDILDITISSRSKDASADFNKLPNGDTKTASGYLINVNGDIEIPSLGKIKAAGFTKTQLKENITNLILTKQLLVDPLVEIRYLNFEVTVLGEVGHPSVINVPSEQITFVKALGLAGDLTIYGKRDNILLVRDEDGVRRTRRININSADFLNSDYYYLKPNDLIYVEPNKDKIAVGSRKQQILPLALTAASFLFFIFDKLIK